MSEPNDLAAFLTLGWQHLSRGVADSRSPARYPTFATVSPDGTPEARTVALRAARRSVGVVQVHTDTATPKIESLRAYPMAALHIWLPKANLQIRLTARVEIMTGDTVQAQWQRIPPASRVSYGTVPDPGLPISDVYAYDKPADPDRFAVLECHLQHIDLVELGSKHRRAAFKAQDGWAGEWLAP